MSGRSNTPAETQSKTASGPKGFDDFDVRLGDIMRGERATMGKSLLDVQRDLKIKATYIAAIENADPTAFESPGFVAGYVRSYARYLNLDPEWAFRTFCDEGNFSNPAGLGSGPKPRARTSEPMGTGDRDPFVEPTVSFIPKGEARLSGIEPGAVGSLAVVVALAAAIGYGGWSVFQEVQKVQFAPIDQAPGVLSEMDPMAVVPDAPGNGDASEVTALPDVAALERLYRPQALDLPIMTPRDAPIASLNPSTVGALAPIDTGAPDAQLAGSDLLPAPFEPPVAPGQSVQVVEAPQELALLAVRPCWVRVQDADGTVIFEKILDAGERFVLPQSDDAHVLRAGNAGSLYFSVNGETYGPAGTGASVVRDVRLTPEDVTGAYVVADLSKDADLARFIAVAEVQGEAPSE